LHIRNSSVYDAVIKKGAKGGRKEWEGIAFASSMASFGALKRFDTNSIEKVA
jgi:hypothetical protein